MTIDVGQKLRKVMSSIGSQYETTYFVTRRQKFTQIANDTLG